MTSEQEQRMKKWLQAAKRNKSIITLYKADNILRKRDCKCGIFGMRGSYFDKIDMDELFTSLRDELAETSLKESFEGKYTG